MVPVGASTVAWLFRTPTRCANAQASNHAVRPAMTSSGATASSSNSAASRCISSTLSIGSRLCSKPSNGPIRSAIRAEVR